MVAPLLVGLCDVMRERLPRHELIEGWAGLAMLTALIAFLISLPDGPWIKIQTYPPPDRAKPSECP